MDCLKNKRYVYTFATTPKCELNHTDLLVFSFVAWQDRYDNKWSYRQIGKRTGLNEETVSTSVDRLTELGLLTEKKAVIPEDKHDWFAWRKTKKEGHFSGQLSGFNNYIKSTDSQLTVIQHSLYSYLLACKESNWKPAKGFSAAYLSEVLCVNVQTTKDAIDNLKLYCLLKYDGCKFQLYAKLNDIQLGWFADTQEFSAAQIEEIDEVAPTAFLEKITLGESPLEQNIEKYLDDTYEDWRGRWSPRQIYDWIGSHNMELATLNTLGEKIEKALDEVGND